MGDGDSTPTITQSGVVLGAAEDQAVPENKKMIIIGWTLKPLVETFVKTKIRHPKLIL